MDDERVEQEIRTALDALPVPPTPGLRSARAGRVVRPDRRSRVSRPLLLGGVVAATIIATIAGSVVFTPPNLFTPQLAAASSVSLTATATDGDEVLADTSFTFASSKPLDPAQVKQGLRITPAIQFNLHQAGDRLVLAPTAPLDPERIYRFTLTLDRKTYEWSFQTMVKLRVLRTLPGDKMTFVPITTGIEIVLSREDYEDPAPYFSISPSVSGRIEIHRNTIAFVPSSLDPATVYTVSLRKGLRAKTGNSALADDYSFAFETAITSNPTKPNLYIDPGPYEVSPKEIPALRGSCCEPVAVSVSVYKYPDAAAFITAERAQESLPSWASTAANRLEPVGSLPRVASFTTTSRNSENGGAFVFPEPLPKGYYLVELENSASSPPKMQARLQVSELSFYATATTTQTLFWVHDVTTGQPARDAHLRIGATDLPISAEGIAMTPSGSLAAPTAGGFYGVVTAAGGKEIVAHIPAQIKGLTTLSVLNPEKYWRYVYLDRPLYKPQDTVQFWGVALAREPGAPRIDEVTVRLYRWGGPEDVAFLEGAATVMDGAFSGSLKLPNLRPGAYLMSVDVGKSQLTWAYFDVATYVKPTYSLAVTPERRAVFAGEELVMHLKTSFFEGTAAPALPLTLRINGTESTEQTDARGEATFRTKPSSTANPEYFSLEARVNRPEAGEVVSQSFVQVFRSSVNVTAGQAQVANGRATIPLRLARVALDRLNGGETGGPEIFLGGAVPGATIAVALSRLDWRRKDVGERYDFVNKEVVRLYEYEQVIVALGSSSVVTDGSGGASYGFAVDGGASYRVRFTARDAQARDHTVDTFVFGADSAQRPAATLEASKPSYKIGETVEVTWQGGRAPTGAVSYLFYTLRSGIGTVRVQTEPTFRFTFTDADVPGTTVRAVRFDGRAYGGAGNCYGSGGVVAFDRSERKLQVTVRPDRAEYRPGDQVTLAIEAKDHTGQPTEATVNVSAVDEALFALSQQQVDLLGSLYGQVPATGELRSWNSRPGDPDCGGGGATGGGPRTGFGDVAYFASVRTDANGKAAVSFKLPDNLTSWRVTYQAFSPKAEVNSGTVPVVVRLPFFVDLVAAESYLATDRPRILVRSFGAGLNAGERVNFTVKLAGPVNLNTQMSAQTFDTGAVELPVLLAGDYTLTVSGEGPRGLKDALEKRFTVRDSNLRRRVVDYQLLQPGLRVAGAQTGLTTLTFTDYERGAAIQALTRAAGITGSRVEQRLARDFGERWLKEKFSIGGGAAKPFDTALYQGTSGGIAILPYADADPEVSAKLADLAPEQFDRIVLEDYFRNLLLDAQASREQVIVALYGLASLDKPVLATLRALAGAGDLSLRERLYLALAHAAIGDATSARAMFREIVRERAETVGDGMRIRADGGRDDLITATALAAAIAAKLGEPEATALLRYTSENRPNEVLTLLEELIAVKATIAHAAPTPVAFTYERGGTATRVELSADENLTLVVRADELAAFSFKDVSGKVGLAVSYDAPFRLADQQGHPGFTVKRQYERDGSVVMVRLIPSIDSSTATGTYQIVDFLPSGLRAIERSMFSSDPCTQGPLEVDGQRVTLWAPNSQCFEIHYYARTVTPGDYLAEPAVLQHLESGEVWGWSDATRLVLR